MLRFFVSPGRASVSWQGRKASEHTLFGLRFLIEPAAAALAHARAATGPGPRMIVTANIDHIVSLSGDVAFRTAYVGAAVRTLDGMPLVWLARARGATAPHRITGHDLLQALLAQPVRPEDRLFIVSPTTAVSEGILRHVLLHGWHRDQVRVEVPPFGFERDEAASMRLAANILEFRTTVLLMGVGAPKSEVWVHHMGSTLGAPLVLCIGDALAVTAGELRRAPVVLQTLGLEWCWRFALAPRRLFHRYFIRSWRFPILVFRNRDLSRS